MNYIRGICTAADAMRDHQERTRLLGLLKFEETCPDCRGGGHVRAETVPPGGHYYAECRKCVGTGTLLTEFGLAALAMVERRASAVLGRHACPHCQRY